MAQFSVICPSQLVQALCICMFAAPQRGQKAHMVASVAIVSTGTADNSTVAAPLMMP